MWNAWSCCDAGDRIGGQLAVAAAAPNRTGWARLLAFYDHAVAAAGVDVRLGAPADGLDEFDAVVLATGAEEVSPLIDAGALASSAALADGLAALAGAEHVVVVDDGFGWWPGINVVELALAAGAGRVTLLTPGPGFAGGIPAESRVQLLQRLAGAGALDVVPLLRGRRRRRRRRDGPAPAIGPLDSRWPPIASSSSASVAPSCARSTAVGRVLAIGDAVVPRRAAHAIAEARTAAAWVASGPPLEAKSRQPEAVQMAR